ncbi:MAG TPA: HD domain-containing protein [Candidatus Polarisedimenticolia bacterium]|nr:HD domain-containing protein [Candidatus Polarisedimenticolia bacterium]
MAMTQQDGSPALDARVVAVARALRDSGGRAFLVGGWVRDLVALRRTGSTALPRGDELDLEVYGLAPEKLAEILGRFGEVKLVGQSFAVYKLAPPRSERVPGSAPPVIDVSLPRRDTKVGPGHRGFQVTGDPHLSFAEATRRRDFTINAMMHDPLTGESIDLWGGGEDLGRRLLRAVDPATFVDDSLRVLRAVQFAARLEFGVDPATVDLCRRIDLRDLPAERLWGEIEKLLLLARRPSLGLEWAGRLGVVDQLFPELKALQGCPQEPEWHPEGDVWVHTLMALDQAKSECSGAGRELGREKQLAVLLAVLCHDFGKPATTALVEGRIRSYEHEEAGIAPTRAFLDRLGLHSLGGFDLRQQVIALVASHLAPSHWFKNRDNVGDGAFRRLARRLEPELLYLVSRADCLGRTGDFSTEAQEWFIERVRALGVEEKPPGPILLGRHLLEMGMSPGPAVGRITRAIYEMQLDGRVTDLEGGIRAARALLDAEKPV